MYVKQYNGHDMIKNPRDNPIPTIIASLNKAMLWLGHLSLTWLYFRRWTLWSVAPDIPMMLFLAPSSQTWSVKKEWLTYSLFYRLPHSFWALLVVPRQHRRIYAFHILCDILSHTGEWSIQPFYPYGLAVHGIWDPVEWT